MKPTRLTLSALLVVLLAACNLPGPEPDPVPLPLPSTPTATITSQQCAWNWNTRPLPELSLQVEEALRAAGLPVLTARAEAYGEDCIDSRTNQAAYFATMETDFHITLEANDLGDDAELGDLLERTLAVLDGFPGETTPGPQPGYVGITFQAGDEESRLWFTVTEGESARALGLHGSALLDELGNR